MTSTPSLQVHWSSPFGASAWRQDEAVITSRRLRKGHGGVERGHYQRLSHRRMLQALVRKKRLHRLEVRTALAFIVGPLLFAVGSALQLHPKAGYSATGLLALGACFFTAGGAWQLQQAVVAGRVLPVGAARWHWCGFWCALTQSLGTVLFNVETLSAWLGPGLDASAQFWLELLPNLLGSILFLISAAYAFLEIGHGRLVSIEPGHLGWWIAVVNGLGCVWFMQSALTPAADADATIRATLIGAVAFTVVGLLSLAECSEDDV